MTQGGMVIIGGGMSGARAVIGLRSGGWQGPIILLSREAVMPYDRPPLSKAAITTGDLPRPEWLLDEGIAASLKAERGVRRPHLAGRTLAQIFEKPSLRTRLSFDVGMTELGGHCVYLSPQEVGLGRRESVADVARVVSRMVDAVVLRTNSHETIEEFARYASIPVINGLSDLSHPCQGLADIMTIVEKKGPSLKQRVIAYVGDGNNVLHSLTDVEIPYQ